MDSYKYVNDWNYMLLQMTNPEIHPNSWWKTSPHCVELRYTMNSDYDVAMELISEITAVFTTANAGMGLYQMLDWLHPSQVMCCNTDGVVFLYDPTTSNT